MLRTLDLKGLMEPVQQIRFLSVQMPNPGQDLPIISVKYVFQDDADEKYLRLDLGKEVFIDHFKDTRIEDAIQEAAPRIADLVWKYQRRLTVNPSGELACPDCGHDLVLAPGQSGASKPV